MLRSQKPEAGVGNVQDWIINLKNNICNGRSRLYPKKGQYDDRYLEKDPNREWKSGVYRCNDDLPFIDFDHQNFEATYATSGSPDGLTGHPQRIYKLSDIIMLIISEHLKSPEFMNKIKIVGAFCCGGVPDEVDQLATILEDFSVKDTSANFKHLMDTFQLGYDDPLEFMNTMKAIGIKTKQAKKNKKGEKKGTSKKSGKKGTSKKSGKKGTLGVAKKQGIGKQKASKAKKSKKIKKVKSKKKSKK